jgi:hypothetical protein
MSFLQHWVLSFDLEFHHEFLNLKTFHKSEHLEDSVSENPSGR